MEIPTGARLGPYEVVAPLGAGGMGEVYRARDTRLDRTVAIKVLPGALASDPQLRERFDREARAISSLNHPHICTLHDVGQENGADFLVLEYLDGETLADRLTRGPLPPADAVRIAIEIAEALAAAHRAGVVHRDLKPANVMLVNQSRRSSEAVKSEAKSASAKLLDFGLAKAAVPAITTSGLSTMPTTPPAAVTVQGTILGTFQYMAPEQIEGLEADARTDIFAFGALLFEMLTGRPAFSGKTRASLIGAILKDDPPRVSSVVPLVPTALDRVVSTCLSKDPDERYQTALDLLRDLKWATNAPVESASAVTAGPTRLAVATPRSTRIAIAALAVVAVAGAAVGVRHLLEAVPRVEVTQFTVSPPEHFVFGGPMGNGSGQATQLAISPDGRTLAFVAMNDRTYRIFLRSFDSLTSRALAGTEGSAFPFWSPDGRFIGFFAEGKLKKISISGGPASVLCDAPLGRGGAWSRDNVIVFAPSTAGTGIMRVAATGGTPVAITKMDAVWGDTSHRFPHFLPDGKHFLYTASIGTCCPAVRPAAVRVASLDGSSQTSLVQAESSAQYASGHLLFVRHTDGTLMAQPFSLDELKLTLEPFPVAEHVSFEGSRYGSFSASPNGVLTFGTGSSTIGTRLTWFDRAGKELGTVGPAVSATFSGSAPGIFTNAALSPSDSRVATSRATGTPPNRDVWIYDGLRSGVESRFTFQAGDDIGPVWSPDGESLAWASSSPDGFAIVRKRIAPSATDETVLRKSNSLVPTDWSRDAKYIAFINGASTQGSSDVNVVEAGGDHKVIAIAASRAAEFGGVFSPDVRWIAYYSNESGQAQVYVQPFPPTGQRYQVSKDGGTYPRWSADGKTMYFVSNEATINAVTVDTSRSFETTAPVALFTAAVATLNGGPQYGVTRDGSRFLVNVLQVQISSSPITVVTNWLQSVQK